MNSLRIEVESAAQLLIILVTISLCSDLQDSGVTSGFKDAAHVFLSAIVRDPSPSSDANDKSHRIYSMENSVQSWHRRLVFCHHLISLFARASTSGGIVRPICLAVFRLITSSNFVGCSTGRSAGLAPFRILSTKTAARRYNSDTLGP